MEENKLDDASAVEIVNELHIRDRDDKSMSLLRKGLAFTPDRILDREVLESRTKHAEKEDDLSY